MDFSQEILQKSTMAKTWAEIACRFQENAGCIRIDTRYLEQMNEFRAYKKDARLKHLATSTAE